MVDTDSDNYFASVDKKITAQKQALCFGFRKHQDSTSVVASCLAFGGAPDHADFLRSSGNNPSFLASSQTISTGSAANPLVGPQLTYNLAGQLIRVDYDDGRYKTLQYTGVVLISVTFFDTGVTRQRTLNYVEGQLISVDEVPLP